MKLKLFIPLFFLTFSFSPLFAQKKNVVMVEINTSAVCGMCKKTLEEGMMYEKGIKKSELNWQTKVFKVWYRTDKTDVDAIRKAISELGYDADSIPADTKAYKNLDPCCKKDFEHNKEE